MKARKGMAFDRQTYEMILEKGTFIVGSPATVREKIEAAHARTGFKNLVTMVQFGTLPDELVRKNIQMLSEEVLPKLKALGEPATA